VGAGVRDAGVAKAVFEPERIAASFAAISARFCAMRASFCVGDKDVTWPHAKKEI
jgi:hypothetical protein